MSAHCALARPAPSCTPGSSIPKGCVILDLESGQPTATFDKSTNDIECSRRLARRAARRHGGFRCCRRPNLAAHPTGSRFTASCATGSVKWSAGWGRDGTTITWGNSPYRDRPTRINDMGTRTHSFDLKTLQVGDAIADDQIGSLTLDDLHIEKGGSALLIIKARCRTRHEDRHIAAWAASGGVRRGSIETSS